MLAIYQDKVEKDVCYETLSEDEPTVYEFKTWMQDISDFIKEKGQRKLVLVLTTWIVSPLKSKRIMVFYPYVLRR